MADKAATAGVVLGLTGTLVGVWGIITPDAHEVRSSTTTATTVATVRHGELVAGGVTLVAGIVASMALDSSWPFLVAAAYFGLMIYELESGLNNDPSNG